MLKDATAFCLNMFSVGCGNRKPHETILFEQILGGPSL